jgi:hypothetical protein
MDEVEYVVPPQKGPQMAPKGPAKQPNLPKKPNQAFSWLKAHKALSIASLVMVGLIILAGTVMVTGKKVSLFGLQLNPLYQQANCADPMDTTNISGFDSGTSLPGDYYDLCGGGGAGDSTRFTITGSFADGTVGVPYSQDFGVSNSAVTECSWNVALNPRIENSTITQTGKTTTFKTTPLAAGDYNITISANCGTARLTTSKTMVFKVKPAATTGMSIDALFGNGSANQPFSTVVTIKNPEGVCTLALVKVTPEITGAKLVANTGTTEPSSQFTATPLTSGDYMVKIGATCNPTVGDGKSTYLEREFTWKVTNPVDPNSKTTIEANFTDGKAGQAYTTKVIVPDSTRGGVYVCTLSLAKTTPEIKDAKLTRIKSGDGSLAYNFTATPTSAGTYKVKIALTCNPATGYKVKSTYEEKEFTWKVSNANGGAGGGTGGSTTAGTCLTAENLAKLVPVYRYWSKRDGDHFYTTDANEKGAGYVAEGISGYVFKTQVAGTKAIYRSYKADITSHYYSTVDDATNYGYANEGILGYAFADEVAGSLPWFRLHKGYPMSDYLETSSTKEKGEVIAAGYVDEGIVVHICTKS